LKKNFNDSNVLELLANLKEAGSTYPSNMIEARRASFIEQAAAMGLLNTVGNGTGSNGGSGTSSPAAGAGGGSFPLTIFLESVLLVAVLLAATVGTFTYRNKLTGFINSLFFPKVQVTSTPPEDAQFTPAIIPVTGEETPTETPTPLTTSTNTVTATVTETVAL